MISVDLYNQKGDRSGNLELSEDVFGVEFNPSLIHQVYVAQQANARINIAHTKDRSEVRGGGIKPWKQKGTGRARHGSIRSPIWVGGGVAFGPRNERNFSKSINKKQKQKALFMALTSKLNDKEIAFLDSLSIKGIKTKDANVFLKAFTGKVFDLKGKRRTLFVVPKSDNEINLSFRNIPNVKVISADSLNVGDLLDFRYAVVLKDSLDVINSTYTKLKK
ncbi:50S ribosomal protein L4 [Candidatus Azambacteria bacterium]|nr:50S ribosomal protein L4 [Candidatus Azambacteria bacterium]